jgi:hypothetical protein
MSLPLCRISAGLRDAGKASVRAGSDLVRSIPSTVLIDDRRAYEGAPR